MAQRLVLDTIVGDTLVTYGVRVMFTLGTKSGETPHKRWSITSGDTTLEEAKDSVKQFRADGYEAHTIKITVCAEVLDD